MDKYKIFFLIGLFGFLQINFSNAQIHDYSLKMGPQINGLLTATEFYESKGYKGSYLARWLFRFELGKAFQLELGAGYGSYAGLDFDRAYYRTEIIPADLRLILNLAQSDSWNPYLYAGAGVLNYKVTKMPVSISPKEVKDKELNYIFPGGLGFEIALSDGFLLDISGGVNYSLTDNLNYYKMGEPYDAYYSGALGFLFVIGGGAGDKDYDGLTNREEKELGTDPNNPDTDGDGLSDGEEIQTFKTNPLNPDTDNDGLKDGEEVKKHKTNPLKADTDGDGLRDGEEINTYRTDPLKGDTDGDGLKDGEELNNYKTDPLKVDTDGDGLKDGDEVNVYKTNPLQVDTDSDGLKDGEEVTQYRTDPLNSDTDGGTVNDGKEIANKTNPLEPADDVPKIEQELKAEFNVPIILEGIVFATNSAEITPASEDILMLAFNTLDRHPEIEVSIQGHTDNVGKRDYNMKLSKRRADAVKIWLVNKGIDPARISTIGYGPDKPIASNDTPEGRQKNRRIEFMRIK